MAVSRTPSVKGFEEKVGEMVEGEGVMMERQNSRIDERWGFKSRPQSLGVPTMSIKAMRVFVSRSSDLDSARGGKV